MSKFSAFGLSPIPAPPAPGARTERVALQQPLHRVLAFTRHSIHDVINNPIAKREVLGYYKLHRWVERACEVSELEHQWNHR